MPSSVLLFVIAVPFDNFARNQAATATAFGDLVPLCTEGGSYSAPLHKTNFQMRVCRASPFPGTNARVVSKIFGTSSGLANEEETSTSVAICTTSLRTYASSFSSRTLFVSFGIDNSTFLFPHRSFTRAGFC